MYTLKILCIKLKYFLEHLPSSGVISSLSDCISFVIGFKDSYNFSSSSPSNFRTRCSGGHECLRLKIIRKKEISNLCVSCAPNVFVKQQNQKIIPNYCHEFKVQPIHSALKKAKKGTISTHDDVGKSELTLNIYILFSLTSM